MRILIACEYSGRVRDAFIARGHNAVSCDLLPTETPGPHYHGDVREILNRGWDAMIAHPDCTYLTNSAAWAFKDGPYHQRVKPGTLVGAERRDARRQAIQFVEMLWGCDIPKIAIENPVGVLSTESQLGEPSQFIQPYEYGDDASKITCLWLKGFPKLVPDKSKVVFPRLALSSDGRRYNMRWGNQTDSGQNKLSPSDNRWKERALTYNGWAEAMADQWGENLKAA